MGFLTTDLAVYAKSSMKYRTVFESSGDLDLNPSSTPTNVILVNYNYNKTIKKYENYK